MTILPFFFSALLLLPGWASPGELPSDPSAEEIIRRADKKLRGESSQAELQMTIVRPSWKRDVQMKTWSLRDDYSLVLITAPARDKGSAFLKREKELWNWQPTIDRVIKMPPSMMMQSWMGSDFTNDDLVRESSIVKDYSHFLRGKEEVDSRTCYKLELQPKEEAAVVWGKVMIWIDVEEYMQLRTEFYDEDGYLVNTLYGKEVKNLGGKTLPSLLEMVPAEEEGKKTMIRYIDLTFDVPMKESFFSVQNMKRVR